MNITTEIHLEGNKIAEIWEDFGQWYFTCDGFSNEDTTCKSKEEALQRIYSGMSKQIRPKLVIVNLTAKLCPKCNHEMVSENGVFICKMNMPHYGCGYAMDANF